MRFIASNSNLLQFRVAFSPSRLNSPAPQAPPSNFFKSGSCLERPTQASVAHFHPPPTLNERSSICLFASALGVAFLATAQAQEIPRPSLSRVREAAPSLERPYNLKLGPIALSASAGLELEYVDNVNLNDANPSGDLIIHPSLTLTGVWQVTKLNSLEMRSTLGYTKYLDHPNLDSQTALISPDSEIRLNIFISDVKLVLHEQFSLQEDPVTQGGVSGVAKLRRFTNTAGATALWDLNAIVWSIGFDHFNFITTGHAADT